MRVSIGLTFVVLVALLLTGCSVSIHAVSTATQVATPAVGTAPSPTVTSPSPSAEIALVPTPTITPSPTERPSSPTPTVTPRLAPTPTSAPVAPTPRPTEVPARPTPTCPPPLQLQYRHRADRHNAPTCRCAGLACSGTNRRQSLNLLAAHKVPKWESRHAFRSFSMGSCSGSTRLTRGSTSNPGSSP